MWIFVTLVISSIVLPLRSQPNCFQTPECRCFMNTDGVQTAECEVYNLYATLQSLPNTITSLAVSCVSDNQQTVTKQILSKFTGLAYLSIAQCTLPHLNNDSLDISSLNTLIIHQCDLDQVTLFFNSSSLQTLNISGSGMTSFPKISPHVNISSLNVSSNVLMDYGTFESVCVKENMKLTELDLSYNYFTRLPIVTDCFESLNILKFSHNPPVFIDENYFKNLTELQVLDLQETIINGNLPSVEHLQNLLILKLQGTGQQLHLSVEELGRLEEIHLREFRTSGDNLIDNVSALVNLTSLELISCNIQTLRKNSFENLTKLCVLDLSWNNLQFLRKGIFDNLTLLKRLLLSHNKLGMITTGTFTLPKLRDLDISCNKIFLISAGAFANLSSLTYLNLTSNRISSLSKNIFDPMPNLKKLLLKENNLKSLPSLPTSLLYLDLGRNDLTNLDEKTFRGLKSLLGVSLSNNSITNVPSNLFRDSSKITILNFANNLIERVHKHPDYPTPWGNLTQLIFLRLDNNKIRYIKDELSYFKLLQALFLDKNQLFNIFDSMFPESLEVLELSNNKISKFGNIFRKLTRIKRVNLQGNYPHLTYIDITSFSLLSVVKPAVYIGFNEFKCDCNMQWLKALTKPDYQLPVSLKRLPIFPDINYTYCQNSGPGVVKLLDYPIEYFTCIYNEHDFECQFNCECCYSAENGQCPCAYWCPENCFCEKGRLLFRKNFIDCESRNKTKVPLALPPDSTIIDLSGNHISTISRTSFHGLVELERLYLNYSAITSLEFGCFDTLSSLMILHLDHNKLQTISPGLFNKLKSLQFLYLHNNNIYQVSPLSFYGVKSIKMLTLHGNELKDVFSLEVLNNLTGSVTLANNDWSCSCDFMDSFLDIIVRNAFKIADVNNVMCFWPDGSIIPQLNITTSNSSSISDPSLNETLVLGYDFKNWCSNKTILVNNTLIQHLLEYDNRFVGTIIGLTFLFITMIILGSLLIWKRRLIQVIVYDKLGIRIVPGGKEPIESNFLYDAFICYGETEEHFVIHELLEKLEKEKKFKMCIDSRDFPVGESKADSIVEAVDKSRKTILIISKSFLDDEWCKFVFQTAHHTMLTDGSDSIIVILKERVDDDLLDPDLRGLLKTRTYVEYGDPWFWEKLYFVMPDPAKRQPDEQKAVGNQDIEFEIVEDKV